MERLHRYILVVTPAQSFVDWVRALEDEDGVEEDEVRYGLEEARKHHVATYLVPYSFDRRPVVQWVRENFETIFSNELREIEPEASRWPVNRTADMFEEWFDLSILDAPIDVAGGPLFR